MAAASESPIQYERDLRSNQHEGKRYKDSVKKWAHSGIGPHADPYASPRPLAGVAYNWDTNINDFEKVRPAKVPVWGPKFDKHINVNRGLKPRGAKWMSGNYSRHRDQAFAKAEIDAEGSGSTVDMLPSPRGPRSAASQSDGVLYSFDAAESPRPVVSLEVFVKPNAKEERKLVEEYEIVDEHGDVVKGKKARRHLRKGASPSGVAAEEELVEVDGFELV